jgi:hypothetical protein
VMESRTRTLNALSTLELSHAMEELGLMEKSSGMSAVSHALISN